MPLRALFVDAANTLLRPREPVGLTYARHAQAAGHALDPSTVEARFRRAMATAAPIPDDLDGRQFWRPVVAQSLGFHDDAVFEAIYQHYAGPRAWWIEEEALRTLARIARRGVRLGIISNFDVRLRVLYARLALDRLFSVLVCSAEVGAEKPDPAVFRLACLLAGVSPREAAHVGDDPVRDVEGARRAGLTGIPYDEETGWEGVRAAVDALDRPYLPGRR